MNSNSSVISIEDLFLLPVSSGGNFCIVSAWHQGKTQDTNRMAHEQLKANVKNLDSGFVELRCTFVYTKNGREQTSEEKTLFVTSPNLHDMLLLGSRNSQVSILYRDKTRFELLETKVGRVLSPFAFNENNLVEDFTIAYAAYILSRNNDIEELRSLSIEKLHIPTQLDSLLRLKDKEGLAEAEWRKLF